MIRIGNVLFTHQSYLGKIGSRLISHYPIDDTLFNLNQEQIQVRVK